MKNHINLLMFLQLFFGVHLLSQKVNFECFGGHSYFLKKDAGGYNLGIGVNYSLTKKSNIGISISHNYNDNSPLPSNLTDAKIVLKEESYRSPLSDFFPEWLEEKNWPHIRLEEQPNRYFRFDFGLHYTYLRAINNNNSFGITIGPVLSWRDESELVKLVETSKLRGLFFRPTDDHSLPVFSYNTYLDLGIKCDFAYIIKSFKRVSIGYRTGFVYYPNSSDLILNNGINFTLRR